MENPVKALEELVGKQALENAQLKYELLLTQKQLAQLQGQIDEQSNKPEGEE